MFKIVEIVQDDVQTAARLAHLVLHEDYECHVISKKTCMMWSLDSEGEEFIITLMHDHHVTH